MLPSFGPPRPKVAVRYRDGLAFQAHGKDIHTWRWEEIAAVQSSLERQRTAGDGGYYTLVEYTLAQPSGEKIILDVRLKQLDQLAAAVKKAVYALIGPPLAQQYRAGQALTFGPVTIHQQNGLQANGKLHAWDAIQDIQVENGQLKLTFGDGKKHNVRVSAVPNFELLCQLIGLEPELVCHDLLAGPVAGRARRDVSYDHCPNRLLARHTGAGESESRPGARLTPTE